MHNSIRFNSIRFQSPPQNGLHTYIYGYILASRTLALLCKASVENVLDFLIVFNIPFSVTDADRVVSPAYVSVSPL